MHGEHTSPAPEGHAGRWVAALLVGLLLAVPIGALLSLAGLLVFYLGLFFFLLFGLMLGAAMFRVLKPIRPVSAKPLAVTGVLVALFAFGVSIWVEAARIPAHVAKKTEYAPSLAGERVTKANAEAARKDLERRRALVESRAREALTERYPPGGVLGYLRWAATDGKLKIESPEDDGTTIDYRLSQGPIGFSIRLVICAAFICLGVVAQLWPLRRARDAAPVSADDAEGVTTASAAPPTSAS